MTDEQLVEIRSALHTIKRLVVGAIFLFTACLLILAGMEYQSQRRDQRVNRLGRDVDKIERISEAIEERYITPPADPEAQRRLADALRKIDELHEKVVVNGG